MTQKGKAERQREALQLQLGFDPTLGLTDEVSSQFPTHFPSWLPASPCREKLSVLTDGSLISS